MTVRPQIITAAVALLLAVTIPASADDKRKYHGGSLDARQHGYEHGYRDGYHRGLEDRDRNVAYKPRVEDADHGYESYMGPKEDYKSGYREGYQSGYGDGYNRRGGQFGAIYGPLERPPIRGRDTEDDIYASRGYGVADVAYDIGYRDGVIDGTRDRNENRSFRPEDQQMYRDAEHGYRSSYGDKESYRLRYRDGYLLGYRDAYGRLR